MKWLEIIHVRTSENRSDKLSRELGEMLPGLLEESPGTRLMLFRRSHISSDFSIHLYQQTDNNMLEKSEIGQILAVAAGEFGLISHTIWLLEKSIDLE